LKTTSSSGISPAFKQLFEDVREFGIETRAAADGPELVAEALLGHGDGLAAEDGVLVDQQRLDAAARQQRGARRAADSRTHNDDVVPLVDGFLLPQPGSHPNRPATPLSVGGTAPSNRHHDTGCQASLPVRQKTGRELGANRRDN